MRHEISAAGVPSIHEWHDIVYRDAPRAGESPPAAKRRANRPVVAAGCHARCVLLFRYSALTFNAHRIHYDRRYVTDVEGYPGLVVHGPLLATLLIDLLREHRPRADLAAFEFRAVRPVFDIAPFAVCGQPAAEGGPVRLWAQDAAGSLAMDATATLG